MKIELSVSTLAALAPGPRLSTTAARFNSTAPQRTSGLLRLWRAALLGFALAVLPGLANAQEIYWRLHGNTNEGGDNFLGIANSGSLDFRVNGFRALRLEFGGTSPNVIGGSLGNFVSSGEGNAIGGGGTYVNNLDTNSLADLTNKIINANFGTIGGGIGNTVSAHHGTVAGGQLNTSSGDAASVGGGEVCAASGTVSTVSGGFENTSSGYAASVGGGANNTAAPVIQPLVEASKMWSISAMALWLAVLATQSVGIGGP